MHGRHTVKHTQEGKVGNDSNYGPSHIWDTHARDSNTNIFKTSEDICDTITTHYIMRA